MLSNLRSDVKGAWRLMAANRTFSAVVVLTLAIGIAATTAMFGALEATMLRPLPYPDPDRLVMGRATFNGHVNPMASAYDYYDYREQSDAFESLVALTAFSFKTTVVGGELPERVDTTFVSYDLFPTLGVRPIAGRGFTQAEGVLGAPDVVMISHHYWQRRFGGAPDAVGASLTVNGQPCTIVGVMPAGFRFLNDVDAWFPMRRDGPYAGARRWHNWLIVGRLKPGVTLAQAREQVDVISTRLEEQYPDSNRNKALQLDPLQAAIVEGQRPRLLTLMGAVGLLLLIACGNVAGLLLARGNARRTELAVRAALGASRGRVAAQLVTESFVLALAGGVLGIALAYGLAGALPLALRLDELGITRVGFGGPVLLFAVGVSLATGVLFGLLPALQASATRPARDLTMGRSSEAAGSARVRNVVVAAQVAVSVILLVGAGLFIRSVARLLAIDPGFTVDRLLTAEVNLPSAQYQDPDERVRFFDELLEEIRALPGVRTAGMVSMLPIRNPANNIYVWREGPRPEQGDESNIAFTRIALPGYFEAIGIPLILGRSIERTDTGERSPVLVVNETMARGLFPDESPLGRRVAVDMGGDEPVVFEVVGVVGDARLNFIGGTPRQAMYHSYYQYPTTTMRMAIRTEAAPESVVNSLRQLVWRRDPNLPVEALVSMDALIRDQVWPFRITATIVSLFSAVALLLSTAVACAGPPAEKPAPAAEPRPATPGAPYVDDAVAVADWLRSLETSTPHGPAWPDDAREPETVTASFATGVAGKVRFFLALHEATGDAAYLADAARGADYLIGEMSVPVGVDAVPPATSFYFGLPGVCLALDAVARATGTARYETGARSCLATVKARAQARDAGVEWSARFDDLLFGNTGTALFLLEVAERHGDATAGALAVRAGRGLIARGLADRGGRRLLHGDASPVHRRPGVLDRRP